MTTTTGPVVVVGAGAAGMATVDGLRRNGFDGHISWIGAESHLPYDRPTPASRVSTSPGGFSGSSRNPSSRCRTSGPTSTT